MKDMESLIQELSSAPVVPRRFPAPADLMLALVIACTACWGVGQLALGFRPDLITMLGRPWFLAEIMSLVAVVLASIGASVLVMYPDTYQLQGLVRLPYLAFGVLAALCVGQLFIQPSIRVQDACDLHGVVCTLSIAAVAVVPAALIMRMLSRGAVVHPLQAGSLAVLTGSALGCLAVRLHEANDSMVHILTWHYLPTLLFAVAGVYMGKRLLKW